MWTTPRRRSSAGTCSSAVCRARARLPRSTCWPRTRRCLRTARCRSATTRRKEGTAMPTLVAETEAGEVPLGPALSIFDPMHVGIDEFGQPIRVPMIYRNMLIGGEPGAGKSALLNAIVAHAALALDCRLCLLDGKQVELGQWRRCADAFVGPNMEQALGLLRRLQIMMDRRYAYLLYCERRKIAAVDTFGSYLVACD